MFSATIRRSFRSTRRPVAVFIGSTMLLWAAPADGQESVTTGPSDRVPVDRWLVSSLFPADGGGGDTPLSAPGEEGVLPDRGREQAGAAWTLVRRDGAGRLSIDSLFVDRPSPSVGFAHTYVRLQEDATLLLSWGGLGDTRVSVWVNGRLLRNDSGEPVETDAELSVPVRLGAGWNTLLFRATEAGSGFGLGAWLSSATGRTSVRIQASRPPGDIRTGPEPWIIADPVLRPTGAVAWNDDELLGELVLEVTAWSRSPVDAVEVRLKADGADASGTARWLTPGAPVPIGLWLPFDDLRRATRAADGVEVELKWADEESKQRLPGPTSAAQAAIPAEVLLGGWQVRSEPSGSGPDELIAGGMLPDAAGWTLKGEWKVPEELSGRDLQLRLRESPGDYRYGDRAFGDSDLIPLCADCRRGEKIEILARSAGPWSSLPTVMTSRDTGDVP